MQQSFRFYDIDPEQLSFDFPLPEVKLYYTSGLVTRHLNAGHRGELGRRISPQSPKEDLVED
jgi:hypothetical protein